MCNFVHWRCVVIDTTLSAYWYVPYSRVFVDAKGAGVILSQPSWAAQERGAVAPMPLPLLL